MQKFYEDYLSLLQDCHNGILHALDGLPSAALDWISGPNMNSISVLIFHLTGAQQYWIGDVTAQEATGRDRDAEFKVRDVGTDVLKDRLDKNIAYIRTVLDRLTLVDLEKPRVSPRDGRTFTVAWALLHALEHSMIHLGHIQITRQLWERMEGNA